MKKEEVSVSAEHLITRNSFLFKRTICQTFLIAKYNKYFYKLKTFSS